MSTSFKYSNWIDFVEAAKAARPALSYHTSHNGEPYWSGSSSFPATVKLAENGWTEGADKIKRMSDAITAKVESLIEIPELHYDVTGADFDVAMMLSGAPEYWNRLETEHEQSPQETIKIAVHIGFLSNVSAHEVEVRGAAIAALIECLEFTNKRVELNLVAYMHTRSWGGGGGKQTIHFETRLKDAEQPLDRDSLAFAVMNASCFRRLIFALVETDADYMRVAGSGYGITDDAGKPSKVDGMYIPATTAGTFRDDNAVSWVVTKLKEQGVTVNV